MEITDTYITNLLLFANAAMLAAALIAIIRFRNQARRFEKFWDSPTGVSLAETQRLNSQQRKRPLQIAQQNLQKNPRKKPQQNSQQNPQLERKVAELQSVVRTLAKKKRTVQDPADNKLPIENAVRMARHGASIDELIRGCGLNRGEALLMHKLHGGARTASQQR